MPVMSTPAGLSFIHWWTPAEVASPLAPSLCPFNNFWGGFCYETGSNSMLGISYPCRSPWVLLPAGAGLPGWNRALRPQCVAHYQQGRSHARGRHVACCLYLYCYYHQNGILIISQVIPAMNEKLCYLEWHSNPWPSSNALPTELPSVKPW